MLTFPSAAGVRDAPMAEAFAAVMPSLARALVRRALPPREPPEPALLALSLRTPGDEPMNSIRTTWGEKLIDGFHIKRILFMLHELRYRCVFLGQYTE
jgi:hypothetical protein